VNYFRVSDQRRSGRRTVKARKRWLMQPTLLVLEDRKLLSSIIVNNPTDIPVVGQIDLRQAIAQANTTGGGHTIAFDKKVFNTPQTITLGGTQLELSDTTGTVTITGPKAGVTVSGGGISRVFLVDKGVTTTLDGLTITGGMTGSRGGGVYQEGGTATLTSCTVSGNSAANGGGVFTTGFSYPGLKSYGVATLSNCTVSGNSAPAMAADCTTPLVVRPR
jgi:hypothetical protein